MAPGFRLRNYLQSNGFPGSSQPFKIGGPLPPIPFSVKVYQPSSLFAGKMHAILCRGWRSRIKGRDWYDLVWYVARGTPLDLAHLEARMRQSGHYTADAPLDEHRFRALLRQTVEGLDVAGARAEVERFVVDRSSVGVWSREFFLAVAEKVEIAAVVRGK